MAYTYPIATPEEAAKFRKELFKPYLCPECRKPFGGKLDSKTGRLVFCGHRIDPKKLPEANTKSRPWGYKGAMILPDAPPVQWISLAPKEWRRLGIEPTATGYRLVFAGSRVPLSARDMDVIEAPHLAMESVDLEVLIMNGNRVEVLLAQLRK